MDFGSICREWNDCVMVNWADGDGPGFVKQIVPTIDAKTSNLVWVDWGVVQFGAMTERLIHDQNVGLVQNWIIPSSSAGHN